MSCTRRPRVGDLDEVVNGKTSCRRVCSRDVAGAHVYGTSGLRGNGRHPVDRGDRDRRQNARTSGASAPSTINVRLVPILHPVEAGNANSAGAHPSISTVAIFDATCAGPTQGVQPPASRPSTIDISFVLVLNSVAAGCCNNYMSILIDVILFK